MVEIINLGSHVPETYVQYPGKRPPSEVYGGTWRSIFDDEGVFFRTAGGEASAFVSGIQESVVGEHTHTMAFRRTNKSGSNTATVLSYYENKQGNITYKTSADGEGIGNETRPINRTIRVWRRVI